MNNNEGLKLWAIDKIKKQYQDDVSLLIGYDIERLEDDAKGPFQYYKGGFDYYVPETEKADSLAKTFILDGIGYDLYPRSWKRIAEMANLDDYNHAALAYAEVLYARSEEDVACFESYRKRLFDNLNNKEFVFKKALERLNFAMGIYQTMMFSENIGEVRMSAGFIADYLATAVAFSNGKIFKHCQTNQLEEMKNFNEIPKNFKAYYEAIILSVSIEELKNLCHLIILTTRKFLEERKIEKPSERAPNYHDLAFWYQELSYTWRRIYRQCHLNNTRSAFMWSCSLQHELTIIKDEFQLDNIDLLSSFNPHNLTPLKNRAEALEQYIVDTITNNGVAIEAYESLEEFLEKNK